MKFYSGKKICRPKNLANKILCIMEWIGRDVNRNRNTYCNEYVNEERL